MKTITLLLLSAMAGMTANAAMVNDTIVDVKDVHRVIITENDSTSSMEIKGMGADSAYHYTYQRRTGSETLLDEHADRWTFSIGGLDVNARQKCATSRKGSVTLSMLGLGCEWLLPIDAPEDYDIKMGGSVALSFKLLGLDYTWQKNRLYAIYGFSWRNYRMKGNRRFTYLPGHIVGFEDFPAGSTKHNSRMKAVYHSIELGYQRKVNCSVWLGASVITNFAWKHQSSLLTKYKLNGRKIEEEQNNLPLTPVTVDFRFMVRYQGINFYVQYNPCSVLRSGHGPQFSTFSVGFNVGF